MSDDLISRKSLLDIFSKNSIFEHITNADGKNAIEIIKEQETVCNIGNVIQQLKENEEDLIKSIREVSPSGRYTASADELKSLIEEYTKEQIKIVKTGGVQNGH